LLRLRRRRHFVKHCQIRRISAPLRLAGVVTAPRPEYVLILAGGKVGDGRAKRSHVMDLTLQLAVKFD
jgi:hypothetical protein